MSITYNMQTNCLYFKSASCCHIVSKHFTLQCNLQVDRLQGLALLKLSKTGQVASHKREGQNLLSMALCLDPAFLAGRTPQAGREPAPGPAPLVMMALT